MTSKEAIKRLRQETCPATYMSDFDKEECLQVVEKDLDRLEKQDKAIEIIKKKNVNILEIKLCENYEEYNRCSCGYDIQELTQEEWNLLKEVFG